MDNRGLVGLRERESKGGGVVETLISGSELEKPATNLNKDAIFFKVFMAAMSLDFRKGHQRWTISELSRASGITRSLIYYYFGNSKTDILVESVKTIGEEFFGLTPERLKLWDVGTIADSIDISRRFIEANPDLAAFYLLHRTKDSPIGKAFRDLEIRHQQKLLKYFPESSEAAVKLRAALLFGLVFASNINSDAVEQAIRLAKQLH